MLDDRAKLLLKALVERYIADGQPVGSRTLSQASGIDLSPATIRHVMADLEDLGLIASPHTHGARLQAVCRHHADGAARPVDRARTGARAAAKGHRQCGAVALQP